MAEPSLGLLDISVVIDHDILDPAGLPDESAISAVTLAELAASPHAITRRRDRNLHFPSEPWRYHFSG